MPRPVPPYIKNGLYVLAGFFLSFSAQVYANSLDGPFTKLSNVKDGFNGVLLAFIFICAIDAMLFVLEIEGLTLPTTTLICGFMPVSFSKSSESFSL